MLLSRRSAAALALLTVACGGDAAPTKVDDTGATDSDPRAPLVSIAVPDGGAVVTEGSSVTLVATITDLDSDIALVETRWLSATGSELCGLSAVNPEATEEDEEATSGTSTCTFEVGRDDTPVAVVASDGEFDSTAEIELQVRTADAPTVVLESPDDGGFINEGEALNVSAVVTDDNDAPNSIQVSLESDISGTLYQGFPAPDGTTEISVDDLDLGDHTLTITAVDRDGFEGTVSFSYEVNSRPGRAVVSIEPDDAGTTDDLMVSIDTPAPDADGDSLTYRYTWYVNGELATGEVSDTVSSSSTTKGELWSVEVSALDGRAVGEAATAEITIGNTAPELSTAEITPDPATTADDLTCTPGGESDPDGDIVLFEYTWQVAGVVQAETSGVLPSTSFNLSDSVVCTITPTDGVDSGAPVRSNTVVIGNATPTEPAVSIAPDFAEPSVDGLVCLIDTPSTDADGDTITYTFEWDADGLVYPDDYATAAGPSSTIELNDTVPAADTDLAEDWTCTVTPNDGTVDGTPGVATAVAATLSDVGDGATAAGSTLSLDAATNYAQAITLTDDITVVAFGLEVSSLATGGTNATIGLFTDTGTGPGSLVFESDATALATGDNELDVATFTDVTAGTYWLVISLDAADSTSVVADSSTTTATWTEADGGLTTLPATWTGTDSSTDALMAWWLVAY